ncbi:alcohol dehydrogenase catalytic domain-containing protein [Palleronia sp.]|uniref:alcohol dehydrogenase catalytic domain-containing protein n=1 Tax=Palleronia sp. TaxID=1940284 RepID=UPI0035C7AB0C
MVRGTFSGMEPGTIVGHEAVGVVEELGPMVRNLSVGDRVVVMSTIACGHCSYCRAGYYSQCDNANPHGNRAHRSVPRAAGREGADPLRSHWVGEAA